MRPGSTRTAVSAKQTVHREQGGGLARRVLHRAVIQFPAWEAPLPPMSSRPGKDFTPHRRPREVDAVPGHPAPEPAWRADQF